MKKFLQKLNPLNWFKKPEVIAAPVMDVPEEETCSFVPPPVEVATVTYVTVEETKPAPLPTITVELVEVNEPKKPRAPRKKKAVVAVVPEPVTEKPKRNKKNS